MFKILRYLAVLCKYLYHEINGLFFSASMLGKAGAVVIYLILGYISFSYVKHSFEFATGILRRVILAVLFGWFVIPIATLMLLYNMVKFAINIIYNFINWLFELDGKF